MRKVRSSNLRGNSTLDYGAVADGSAAGFESPRHGNVRGSTPHRSAIFFGRLTGQGPASPGQRLVRLGVWASCAQPSAKFLGNVTGRESGARSNRDGWFCAIGDQDLTFPPVRSEKRKILQTADVPAVRDGDEKPRTLQQGGPGPRQSHKLLKIGSTPIPATKKSDREVQVRTGWCRRRAVNAVPLGKRFDSVRFPPNPTLTLPRQRQSKGQTSGCSLKVEQVSATHQARFRLPASAPLRLVS
jgi:hypothetical protein